MRYIIFIFFILFLHLSSLTQFHRTYFNATTTSQSFFSNYNHFSEDGKLLFTNLYIDDYTNEMVLTTLELDDEGEVVDVQKYKYTTRIL